MKNLRCTLILLLCVFMMLSAFYLLVGLVATLVIDLSYGIIDPRIRMGAK